MTHLERPGIESSSSTRGGVDRIDTTGVVNRWQYNFSNALAAQPAKKTSKTQLWLRKRILPHLENMQCGYLIIQEGDEQYHMGDRYCGEEAAIIIVHDAAVYSSIAFNGVLGAAEAFMDGFWESPDLVRVIQFMVRNLQSLQGMDKERSWLNRLALTLLGRVNRNNLLGSRRNISAHYDLGNDFFSLFLDETMMYSAALFEGQQKTLQQASIDKLKAICEKLELSPDDHLLEIGTGWGGMALYAAKNYGCKVTTTTISRQQYDYTLALVKQQGMQHKITVLLKDYRELEGQYDKLVSIEMIEAVGHQYFSSYFKKCSALLKSHGLMAIQAITIMDQRYEKAKKSVDFIQRYIFPGGCLPSMKIIAHHVAEDSNMNIVSISDMTPDYAETLKCWRNAFEKKISNLQDMKFDKRFIRMWHYYLSYCEGGFRERVIATSQLVMAKPDYRRYE